MSSRRESPAVPPTRDAQERCVGCALSGALRTREGNGTDTPLAARPGQSAHPDAVTGRRGPRESRARAARRTRGRRTAARTTVFVLAFHVRLIVGVHIKYTHGNISASLPQPVHLTGGPTPHKTQLTCPPSRSVRRNRRARHRTPRIENGHMRPHSTSPHMRPRTRPSPTAHTASHIMLIITGTKR